MKKYIVAVVIGEGAESVASYFMDKYKAWTRGNDVCEQAVDELQEIDKNGSRYQEFTEKYNIDNLSIYEFDTEAEFEAVRTGLGLCSARDEKTWFCKVYDDGATAPYEPVAWKVSEDDLSGEDFANYDTSALTPQQIDEIIEEIDDSLANNDEMATIFWATIRDIAESHGLKKRS